MDDPYRPIRVLSLDGGGIRGLPALFVLRELMKHVNETRRSSDKLEPWQLFDMIGGTSTGGLIGIMLGRLHMSINECISAYLDFSESIVKPKQLKWNVLLRPKLKGTLDQQKMNDIIKRRSSSFATLDDKMRDPSLPCKVFVLASRADTKEPILLRSYDSLQSRTSETDFRIWEAVRATTTSSFFSEPSITESQTSTLEFSPPTFHNPIQFVYDEARSLWPKRELILVSIGAGAAPRNNFSGMLGNSIAAAQRISIDAEAIAHKFGHEHTGTSMHTSLYRFNAREGLADIGLEEFKFSHGIEAVTLEYLSRPDTYGDLRRCAQELSEINYEETSKVTRRLESQRAIEIEIRTLANSLSPTNMYATQNDIFAKVQEGTGASLLASSTLQSWLHGKTQTLLCTGIPGTGKTVFASQVIDSLSGRLDDPVLYFYADIRTRRTEQQRPAFILASLLKQLIIHNRLVSDETRSFLERHIKERNSLPAEGLLTCIEHEITRSSKVFVVIDALDELSDFHRWSLLRYLHRLQWKRTVSLMATSRIDLQTIRTFDEMFLGYQRLDIHQTEADIEAFVLGQMSRLPSFLLERMDLQEHVRTEIMSRSHGVFLVAKLLLDSLVLTRTPRQLKSALSSLPGTLEEFYNTILTRIERQDPASLDLAVKIFTWISYAQRPLTAVELQNALAVEADSTSLDTENLVDTESLLSVCAGLVTVTAESNAVTFVHVTVSEYFRSARNNRILNSETDIASTCLTYLGFDCFAEGRCVDDEALQRRLRGNPFLDYAAHFWGFHARNVSSNAVDNAALKLLKNDARISSCSQIILEVDGYSLRSKVTSPESVSGLHLVAYFGIERLALALLDSGSDIGATDSSGRDPLSWAVGHNQIGIVPLLLSSGANITSQDKFGRTPLALAAINGYEEIVRMLLSHGADVSLRDKTGQTALSLAATYGHLSLVKLLVDQPDSHINSRDNFGRTPLICAAEEGRDTTVAYLMVRSDVDINVRDDRGQTPLMTAARRGQARVVEILLAQPGVKANMKDSSGRTAIMWAAKRGQVEALELLLAHDDAAEALKSCDYSGRTPLDWATVGKQEPVRKLLLSREIPAD